MNRRDFLKTAVLALSALALPKLPAPKPKQALTGATLKDLSVKGAVAAKDLRAMAEAAGEAAKGLRVHSLQDCYPITNELYEDGVLYPDTLMGGPVRWEETADGWSCVDVEPPPGYIRLQGILKDGPRNPFTLMGYPVVAVEHLPGQVIVTVDSTDYTELPPVVIV